MKNPLINVPLVALSALVSLTTLFTSCKDDKKDDPEAPKSYRLKTIEFTEDGDSYKNSITYTTDNKIGRFSEIENGVETYRSDWEYNGNEVTVTESYRDDAGQWITDDSYEKLIYQNGHLAESQYYYKDTLVTRNTYVWNGTMLANEAQFYYNADTVAWQYNLNYTYDGTKLLSAEWSAMGLPAQKQVIEYQDGKAIGLKLFDENNILQESSKFEYTGDKITTISSYNVVVGVQGDIDCTETRVYDGNKCVTDITNSCPGEGSYTEHITYEEGPSNFNDFILTQVSWISVYLFPDTFPSELAYKKKKK